MEYVAGRSLKAIIREDGALDPVTAIDIVVQILRAARFAHRRGVIHRDLKPHNVILDEEGRARVTDFGIARAGASDMTLTGSVMGTAQYLSPEQAQGFAVSSALGPLLGGRDPVRAAHRGGAVRGRIGGRDRLQAGLGGAPPAERTEPRDPPVAGRRRDARPGKGPRPALRRRRRADRRARTRARGPARLPGRRRPGLLSDRGDRPGRAARDRLDAGRAAAGTPGRGGARRPRTRGGRTVVAVAGAGGGSSSRRSRRCCCSPRARSRSPCRGSSARPNSRRSSPCAAPGCRRTPRSRPACAWRPAWSSPSRPPAGSAASKGSTVKIVVSGGPANVALPDVHGLHPTEASDRLHGAGFSPGDPQHRQPDRPLRGRDRHRTRRPAPSTARAAP